MLFSRTQHLDAAEDCTVDLCVKKQRSYSFLTALLLNMQEKSSKVATSLKMMISLFS